MFRATSSFTLLILLLTLFPTGILAYWHVGGKAKFAQTKDGAKSLASAVLPKIGILQPNLDGGQPRIYVVDEIQLDSDIGSYLLMSRSQCEIIGLSLLNSRAVKRKGENRTLELYSDIMITFADIDVPGSMIQSGVPILCDQQHFAGPRLGISILSGIFNFFATGEEVYCSVTQTAGHRTRIAISI